MNTFDLRDLSCCSDELLLSRFLPIEAVKRMLERCLDYPSGWIMNEISMSMPLPHAEKNTSGEFLCDSAFKDPRFINRIPSIFWFLW